MLNLCWRRFYVQREVLIFQLQLIVCETGRNNVCWKKQRAVSRRMIKKEKNGSFPVLEKWEKKIQIKWWVTLSFPFLSFFFHFMFKYVLVQRFIIHSCLIWKILRRICISKFHHKNSHCQVVCSNNLGLLSGSEWGLSELEEWICSIQCFYTSSSGENFSSFLSKKLFAQFICSCNYKWLILVLYLDISDLLSWFCL